MSLQLTPSGQLKHLLTIDGLNKTTLLRILDLAEEFFDPKTKQIIQSDRLKGKTIANLFFENSTRTRSTFELAGKRLSANILNLNVQNSATSKGESLRDTVRNIEAMQCHIIVIRHMQSGAAHFVAQHVMPGVSVINAGDGWHAHPSQALLDMFTIRKHRGDFHKLNVAIVGDIKHSRVARSQIHALHLLGAKEIRIIGPKTLLPSYPESLGVNVYYDLTKGLKDVDVIMMLRLQTERMQQGLLPEGNAYYRMYGLTEDSLKLAHPNALIVHPGPINRGVEIQSDIADSPNAAILDQVTNGVAVRMAVMSLLSQARDQ
ncbi:aspartate carbamoyltransferase catalytic subunit [Candidatus Berkiella cookevillensis]|uniref:Aspartate carbamoyltransferase n=1 Tax=Candidatus Berkiella cookevillensis TaxID=437022 RepID=A0A0Q9YIW6_9GAMM|nr:aspartate carbamoyltransferase catalytic subunit [Candidatus Berkiella cookevillensis]MCS5707417.1 aspartate carbamoyltransferase catalytic subunit [Candidatus Berkiella cookevillensis]